MYVQNLPHERIFTNKIFTSDWKKIEPYSGKFEKT